MDSTSSLVPALFAATFLVAIVFGVMQYFKAKKAREENHHSATERQKGAGQGAPDLRN